MSERQESTYGPYAAIYNRLWGDRLAAALLPHLDDLLLRHLPAGAELLDLCCGTGQVAAALDGRGCRVTGLDISPDMLQLARANAPGCRFLEADARDFALPPVHHGVLSTSEALNEIVGDEALDRVFGCVFRALRPGGRFVCGLLRDETYAEAGERTHHHIADDHVLVAREVVAADLRSSRTDLTLFYRPDGPDRADRGPEGGADGGPEGGWRRWDSVSWYRLYSNAELERALAGAGFAEIAVHERSIDLGWSEPARRRYVAAVKPPTAPDGAG